MKFSLIIATLDRTKELEKLLDSLKKQVYQDFEVIIVDQNKDTRLKSIIEEFNEYLEIIWLKSKPGLSKARNVGLKKAKGDIIAFPDDDCWYKKETLARVLEAFEDLTLDGITGMSVDENGNLSVRKGSEDFLVINRINVWHYAVSITVFLKSEVINNVGYFDEELGAGAGTPWGSGEETDYLIRALNLDYKLKYIPNIKVCHPSITDDKEIDENFIRRGMMYGRGMGRVLKKHDYSLKFVFYNFLKPLGGYVLSLLQCKLKKARYHKEVLFNRYIGWKES